MPRPAPPDPKLLEFCANEDQVEVLQAYIDKGTAPAASKYLLEAKGRKIDETSIIKTKKRVEGYAAARGWSPTKDNSHLVPEGHHLKGLSSFVDADGKILRQWVKTDKNKEKLYKAYQSAIDTLCEGIQPFEPVKPPSRTLSSSLTDYTVTDFHLGMYAWEQETGGNWDMEIAERTFLNAFCEMMDGSPDSEQAIFSNIGDLNHWDNVLEAKTPMSGHILDADTRFDHLIDTCISICEKAIEMLLLKHERVHVIHAEGNHDMSSSNWMRRISARCFRDNPRVTVETSPFPFYHFLWGKTFLGWHHGHLQKMDNLPLIFSTDPKFREDFGRCTFAHIKTGHRHQKEMIEKGGIIVEQVETLANRDGYAARGFPYSNRGTIAVTYDKERGEVSRVTVRPPAC